MTGPTPETTELSNRFYAPTQFRSEDQGNAFSQEILMLSQPTPAIEQTSLQTSTQDQITTTPNTAVDNLPALSVDQTAKPTDAKLDAVTNTVLDIGLGTAAVIGAEAILGVLTKNPEFEGMALQTFQTGGKFALLSSPKFLAPFVASTGTAFGAAIVGRHYAVEGLTGKSESWSDSANHVGLGATTFVAARFLGTKLASA